MGRVELEPTETLGGSFRSLVLRAAVLGAGGKPARPGLPATVVVKAYDRQSSGNSIVREPAALGLLRALPPGYGPELLAVADEPPLVVLADLGSPPNLSGLLRGEDTEAARAGVLAWADRIGALHGATHTRGADFAGRLRSEASRLGVETPALDDMDDSLAWVVATLPEAARLLGVTVVGPALEEIRAITGALGGTGEASALTPADACPDNSLVMASGLTLLDFESAEYRHVAWDAAYLTVPWPSCWCSWRLPGDVATEALGRWRAAVGVSIPYVLTPEFDRDLELTTAAWAVISSTWLLEQAAAADPSTFFSEAGDRGPEPLALVQHRLLIAASTERPELGSVARLAGELLAAVIATYGEREVSFAPAWLG
jgi:hypothetical protein